MADRIPFLDLPAQHRVFADELKNVLSDAIDTAGFIGGPHVAAFEKSFAQFCNTGGCVGVANGTDSLMLSLRALGVGPGDEVVIPAFTFVATAEAVSMVGATPRLVAVDPTTYTLCPKALANITSEKIKAIIPVHIYGQPADMDPILAIAKEKGWKVVEDAAQAHGASYKGRVVGSMGDTGSFSFYPGKNLGAIGDAGAVVSSNEEVLKKVRIIANHGRVTKTEHGVPGVNSRLDAIQAAALNIKLRYVRDWNAARARVAQWYNAHLAPIEGITLPEVGEHNTHVYHLYVIQVGNREKAQAYLNSEGISAAIHYPLAIHSQPAYAFLGHNPEDFPVATKLASNCLSLPMFPELDEASVKRVAQALSEFTKAGA